LVEAGYPLNQVDDAGNTLFHLFVKESRERESDEFDVIDFFMEKGGDMFLKNHGGETAFDIAAKKKPHIMKHLLENCDNKDFCKVVSEMKYVEWECLPSLMQVMMSRLLTMMAENQTRILTMMAV
jgi:ankyrin repeat protein